MAELIRPTTVNIISKDGECKLHIIIDLNLNLNTSGTAGKAEIVEKEKIEEEKPLWEIPEFKTKEKIKFGKKEE
jgi:hypothetical protein